MVRKLSEIGFEGPLSSLDAIADKFIFNTNKDIWAINGLYPDVGGNYIIDMTDFLKRLKIDKDYVFLGERKELISILQETRIVNFKLVDHEEFKIYPDVSWGTMIFKGGLQGLGVEGINVKAKTSPLGTDRLKVNFSTRIRPEHHFIIGLFVFFYIVTILSNEPWTVFLYLFGLWIICHSWFQFIYRTQEKHLIEKVIKKLRLVKM